MRIRSCSAVAAVSLIVAAVRAAPSGTTQATAEPTWEDWGITTKNPTGWSPAVPQRISGTNFYAWIVDVRIGGAQYCTSQIYRGGLYVECDGTVYRVRGSRLIRVPGAYGTIVGEIDGGLLTRYCDKYECLATEYIWKSRVGTKRAVADAALGDSRGVWLFSYEDQTGTPPALLETVQARPWGKPRLLRPKKYPEAVRRCGVSRILGNADVWVFDLRCEDHRQLLVWNGQEFAALALSDSLGEPWLDGSWLQFQPGSFGVELRNRPLALSRDPLVRRPPEQESMSGQVRNRAGDLALRWRLDPQRPIVEQQVQGDPWTPVPFNPTSLVSFEAFVHDGEIWVSSDEGFFSTRRPSQLWVARHPSSMMASDFVPSPPFAAPGCRHPFDVLYTSEGSYLQAVAQGRTVAGVFPPEGEPATDTAIYQHHEAGIWYFGVFVDDVQPRCSGQILCIAKDTVSRVRLR